MKTNRHNNNMKRKSYIQNTKSVEEDLAELQLMNSWNFIHFCLIHDEDLFVHVPYIVMMFFECMLTWVDGGKQTDRMRR